MKKSAQVFAIGLGLLNFSLIGPLAAADIRPVNTDCYLRVSQLQMVHGCIYTTGEGPGPCQSWVSHGPFFSEALTRTALNQYQISHPELGLSARVVFNGRDKARIFIQAPRGVNQSKTVGVGYENYDTAHKYPDAGFTAEFRDVRHQLAFDYQVTCSFGLSDGVDAIKSAETVEMNALGPAQEWPDAAAASVQNLPVGTIFELTQAIEIGTASDWATKFVEQNGLMTESGFDHLKLPYRFAYAEIFNANNGFMNTTHYPRGSRFRVVQVVTNTFDTGGHSFHLMVKLVDPTGSSGVKDPITRITVTGRRSGSGDLKIPQLAALLRPYMSLQLPR